MKKILFTAMCASAALLTLATACQKENIESNANETEESIISFASVGFFENDDTKVHFGTKEGNTVPVLWDGNEQMRTMFSYTSESATNWKTGKNIGKATKISSDKKTIEFIWSANASNELSVSNAPLTYYVATPSGYTDINVGWTANAAVEIKDGKSAGVFYFDLPAEQTPLQSTPDSKAFALVGKSKAYDFLPSTENIVKFTFNNVFAYINIKIINLPEGEEVKKVTIESDTKIAGTIKYNCTNTNASGNISEASFNSYKVLTLNVSGLDPEIGYLAAVSPSSVKHNELTICAYTTNGKVYRRTITPDGGLTFSKSKVLSFGVDMSQGECEQKYYGDTELEGIDIDGVVWAPVNCGYSAENPTGLVYQWGRKDGFKQGTTFSGETLVTIDSPFSIPNDGFAQGVFYVNYASVINASSFKTLSWNELSELNANGLGNPCPEGWQVPTYDQITNLKTNTDEDTKDEGIKVSGTSPFSESSPYVFLPSLRDYKNDGSMQKTNRCLYYSCDASVTTTPNYTQGGRIYNTDISSGSAMQSGPVNKSWAYAVRCVKVTPAATE